MNSDAMNLVAKALQAQAATTVNVRTGVARSDADRVTGVISVALDNDPSGGPVSAVSVAGLVTAGARVLMLAYPPRGLVVIGQIGGTPDLQFLESHDYTNQAPYTSATATLGAITVGFAFVAPASGQILLEVSPSMDLTGMNTTTNIGARGRVFAQVRAGDVLGAGTLIWDGDGDQGPLVIFENQKAGGTVPGTVARAVLSSGDAPVSGLTPGLTYNASLWYRLENSNIPAAFSLSINSRRLTGLLIS